MGLVANAFIKKTPYFIVVLETICLLVIDYHQRLIHAWIFI